MQDKAKGAQRFFAADMGGALKQLTDAFGADALLLSSRRVGKGVEVVGMPPQQDVALHHVNALAASLHSERRVAERRNTADERRRRAERRDVSAKQAPGAGHSTTQAAAQPAERRVASSGALQPGATQRLQFGATLARLSSEHAGLLDPSAQAGSNPAAGIRRAASAIAAHLAGFGADHHADAAVKPAANAETVACASLPGDSPTRSGHTGSGFTSSSHNGGPETAADSDIQVELRALRAMLEASLAVPRDALLVPTPERYLVQHRLAAMGLSESICKALVESVAGSAEGVDGGAEGVAALWSACRERLALLLPLLERDPFAGGGLFALVGPAGAGKSSLLAALLARAVAAREHDNTAICYVEGARDTRIVELAGLAGIPCTPLRIGDSLQAQLAAGTSRRTVFIDTPSNLQEITVRWRSDADALQLRELLVLPATGERRYLRDALQRYRTRRTLGCALTFFQRAQGIGEVLSLLLSERLPLALVASAALLPEHLLRPDAGFLLQRLGFASSCSDDTGLLAPIVTAQPGQAVSA
ncbi:MAG: hypothetical protein WBN40_12965 [Pseudomonadales bacterium]